MSATTPDGLPAAAPRPRRIALLGGTGFVGTALAARLAADGHELRLLTRDPRRAAHLRVLPGARVLRADVHDEAALRRALEGCDTVVNLVGILNERGFSGRGFAEAHAALAQLLYGIPQNEVVRVVLTACIVGPTHLIGG